MDLSQYVPAGMLVLLLPVLGALVGVLIAWAIIRSAVISAMRAHQHWLDKRELEVARTRDWTLIEQR